MFYVRRDDLVIVDSMTSQYAPVSHVCSLCTVHGAVRIVMTSGCPTATRDVAISVYVEAMTSVCVSCIKTAQRHRHHHVC